VRKPRSDSKLKTLPWERQEQLTDWLLAGVPYREIKERVEQEFEITTSDAALSDYWQEFCGPALIARRQKAVSLADEIAEEAASQPGRFDQATLDALKQKAFELAVNPTSDPRDVKGLFMLVLKARDQEMDRQQMEFEREKFRQGLKSDLEKAIDAFHAECMGNAAALQAWEKLRAAVLEKVDEAA